MKPWPWRAASSRNQGLWHTWLPWRQIHSNSPCWGCAVIQEIWDLGFVAMQLGRQLLCFWLGATGIRQHPFGCSKREFAMVAITTHATTSIATANEITHPLAATSMPLPIEATTTTTTSFVPVLNRIATIVFLATDFEAGSPWVGSVMTPCEWAQLCNLPAFRAISWAPAASIASSIFSVLAASAAWVTGAGTSADSTPSGSKSPEQLHQVRSRHEVKTRACPVLAVDHIAMVVALCTRKLDKTLHLVTGVEVGIPRVCLLDQRTQRAQLASLQNQRHEASHLFREAASPRAAD